MHLFLFFPLFSSPRVQEWTALQNLPSLPRDLSAVDLVAEAECATALVLPGEEPVAPFASSPAEGTTELETVFLDMEPVQLARAKAKAARARANDARRTATQKTATATALTIHAKEMIDVAATFRGSSSSTTSLEHSGVQTPNVLSERGGRDKHADAALAEISSPSTGNKRARAAAVKSKGKGRGGKKAKVEAAPSPEPLVDEDTDLEDSEPIMQRPAKAAKKAAAPKVSDAEKKVARIQATDSIITANGKKCRRGCLNCHAIKTPQWRMGPDGPKTLCNACGVRFRKGLPLLPP